MRHVADCELSEYCLEEYKLGKFILYSDQMSAENEKVHTKMKQLLGDGNLSLGYIPSTGDKDRKYFNNIKSFYKKYGIQKFIFFDIDEEYDNSKVNDLLSCDVIHLSGGDPIFLLKNIKKRNFKPVLKKYADAGTIIGVSGGACNIGKNIALFKLFTSNLNEALSNRNNLNSLELTDFEFLPHYNRWNQKFKDSVKKYSERTGNIIYACNDGDGIIINNGEVELIGNIVTIKNGKEI